VPAGKLCMKIMQEEHDVPMVRYHGEWTTIVAIRKKLYWLKMKEDVKHFVHTCVKCQNMKSIYLLKKGLYKPLLIPNEPWNSVSMDFMMQLFEWNGMDVILVIVNWLSKLAKIIPTNMIIMNFDSTKMFLWHVG